MTDISQTLSKILADFRKALDLLHDSESANMKVAALLLQPTFKDLEALLNQHYSEEAIKYNKK